MDDKILQGLKHCRQYGSLRGLDCNGYCEYTDDRRDIVRVNNHRDDCPYGKCETGCVITLADDAIGLIGRLEKELEFEKGFNGVLCEAIAGKRKVLDPSAFKPSRKQNGKRQWVPCCERLPEPGEDVILCFRDTYHTHSSWPRVNVVPAWRCNVGEESSPNGAWAIVGRLWNDTVIDMEDGIAWMPMPASPVVCTESGRVPEKTD